LTQHRIKHLSTRRSTLQKPLSPRYLRVKRSLIPTVF
jgi:hypothetical protein